jgi:hypothetical protein
VKVRVLFFEGCPSYTQAIENVRGALTEAKINADIELIKVSSREEALAQQFLGSPTIQINGVDLEGPNAQSAGVGFGCRVYNQGGKLQGWPSKEQIRSAILESSNRELPIESQPGCCNG